MYAGAPRFTSAAVRARVVQVFLSESCRSCFQVPPKPGVCVYRCGARRGVHMFRQCVPGVKRLVCASEKRFTLNN